MPIERIPLLAGPQLPPLKAITFLNQFQAMFMWHGQSMMKMWHLEQVRIMGKFWNHQDSK